MAYDNLKSYLQNEYNDYLRKEIERFEKVNSAESQTVKVEGVNVKSVCCTESDKKHIGYFSYINMKIEVLAYVAFEGQREEKKYIIHNIADLERSNTKLEFLENQIRIVESDLLEFHESSLYEEFMIPYMPPNKLEDIADEFFEYFKAEYSKKAKIHECYLFPEEEIVERLRINMVVAKLPESTMGRVYFKEDKLEVTYRIPFRERCINHEDVVTPGTIVISEDSMFAQERRHYELVVPHEIIHWIYHHQFFKILSLLDQDCVMLNCNSLPQKFDEGWSNKQRALWIAEWQANALGMRIAMPREQFESAFEIDYCAVIKAQKESSWARNVEMAIRYVAAQFIVAEKIAKQRAIQLGYDMAEGTYIHVNNKYWDPFYFPQGTLKQNQTFVIDEKGLETACSKDAYLKALLDSEEYIYLGYVVCKNDRKYVEKIEDDEDKFHKYGYKLTEYAKDHADECCLIFNWKFSYGKMDEGGFYGQCYLNKNFSADGFIEYSYKPEPKDNQSDEEVKKVTKKIWESHLETNTILHELDSRNTFGKMLKYHMKRKKVTIKELSERSLLSETTIKKYRDDKSHPPLENMMAIFIGLNLKSEYCKRMLETEAYSLTGTNQKQFWYLYLIEGYTGEDIYKWNQLLRENDLPEIPNKKNQK